MNDIEMMMSFVSMMDGNVTERDEGEGPFLRKDPWVIIFWKGVKEYIKMKIRIKVFVKVARSLSHGMRCCNDYREEHISFPCYPAMIIFVPLVILANVATFMLVVTDISTFPEDDRMLRRQVHTHYFNLSFIDNLIERLGRKLHLWFFDIPAFRTFAFDPFPDKFLILF